MKVPDLTSLSAIGPTLPRWALAVAMGAMVATWGSGASDSRPAAGSPDAANVFNLDVQLAGDSGGGGFVSGAGCPSSNGAAPGPGGGGALGYVRVHSSVPFAAMGTIAGQLSATGF